MRTLAKHNKVERLCIVSRCVKPIDQMLRFVETPDGHVVVDLKNRLGGRGVWLTASRSAVIEARERKLFSKYFRRKVDVGESLEYDIERLLTLKLQQDLALINKAGKAFKGWTKVEAATRSGLVKTLIQASDGAENGRQKMIGLARRFNLDLVISLTIDQLTIAFGGENMVHVALTACQQTKLWRQDAKRLERFIG